MDNSMPLRSEDYNVDFATIVRRRSNNSLVFDDENGENDNNNNNNNCLICSKLAAGKASCEQMNDFKAESRLNRFEEQIHKVPWSVIRKERLLGQGSFSLVYKVQLLMGDDASSTTSTASTNSTTNGTSLNSKKCYALKHINPDIMEESMDFRIAAIDLAMEGEVLSRLRHENIIKLHGVYSGDPETAYVDFKHGYFLLIDVLDDTLTCRLGKMRRTMKMKRVSANSTMLDMIRNVAIGIAKGLEYLHEKGVILRDLKPANVGFDENDTPVIFDLGFARELHTLVDKPEVAGSLRYMSPEMELGEDRMTLASDVYSFGVLLYELCTLKQPFKKYRRPQKFIEKVFLHNYRPSLTNISSKAIKDLISNCWDKEKTKRPNMKTVGNILRFETASLLLKRRRNNISRTRSWKFPIRRIEQSVSSKSISPALFN